MEHFAITSLSASDFNSFPTDLIRAWIFVLLCWWDIFRLSLRERERERERERQREREREKEREREEIQFSDLRFVPNLSWCTSPVLKCRIRTLCMKRLCVAQLFVVSHILGRSYCHPLASDFMRFIKKFWSFFGRPNPCRFCHLGQLPVIWFVYWTKYAEIQRPFASAAHLKYHRSWPLCIVRVARLMSSGWANGDTLVLLLGRILPVAHPEEALRVQQNTIRCSQWHRDSNIEPCCHESSQSFRAAVLDVNRSLMIQTSEHH